MKIAVIGTGGVGGVFGARLAQGGCDVTFIARGEHLAAIKNHGLKITNADTGDFVVNPAQATSDTREVGQVDCVLFAVKLWDTESAAPLVKPLLGKETCVISLQNGILRDDVLRSHVGANHVAGGVSYIAAFKDAPGVIRQKGDVQKLVFGEYGAKTSSRLERFKEVCVHSGITAELHEEIEKAIWEKFVFLVAMSSVTAATRQTIGPVRDNPKTRGILVDVMTEALAVARAKGVQLDDQIIERRLAYCDQLAPEVTSSMQFDLSQGNRLELPWLSGAVVELGTTYGVPTPVNRVLVDLLSPFVNGNGRV